ncbi:hypothetical protein SAMN05661096_00649 [Marivirga sericea]|uniref:Uncharacterized protein n=1 Tax=Marivirga sericea TaxID=1028 RepID=A0A1X7IHK9_9BACT|nr:hypothetical protein [Marivirga sericea]SMG14154.1 hypothetical protein SAMN05661096_00649 [Marivirga sericea]
MIQIPDFTFACHFILEGKQNKLVDKSEEVGRMLNHMIENLENINQEINDGTFCKLPTAFANYFWPTKLTGKQNNI